MKDLHIVVNNKIATYHKRDGDIVCGNNDYQIVFTFDDEWNGYATKTARFIWNGTYTDVVFTGNICTVPIIQNATKCEVGVFAGNLATTTPAEIGCVKSILCGTGVPAPPSEDVYSQIMEALAKLPTADQMSHPILVVNHYDAEATVCYCIQQDYLSEELMREIHEPFEMVHAFESNDVPECCIYVEASNSVVVSIYMAGGDFVQETVESGNDQYFALTNDIEQIIVYTY